MTNLTHTQDARISGAIMSAVLNGDVSRLTEEQRLELASAYARALGLNPTLGAIQFIQKDGKTILYITAMGLFQLAARYRVSFRILEKGADEREAWALVEATTPGGRVVQEYGGVMLSFASGRQRSRTDAIMTAITKAKARAVRSLFGLPLSDAEAKDIQEETQPQPQSHSLLTDMGAIYSAETLSDLAAVYKNLYSTVRDEDTRMVLYGAAQDRATQLLAEGATPTEQDKLFLAYLKLV